MTLGVKKIWVGVIWRSISAVLAGVGVVAAFVALLSLYGVSPESTRITTARSLKFPENEKMLDIMSDQLAHEGAALSEIEPAAGDNSSGKHANTNTNTKPAQ